jgi:hypothetical protein
MSEGGTKLVDLVRDVYIKPIRSLLAIDDEFPTLDELLNPEEAKNALEKMGTTRLREILKFARTRPVPWLVDVHDGKDISGDEEKVIAPRLHASDLMVLDYKLRGDNFGGDTAIEIIRGLATNDHFNLVILYTKGDAGSVIDTLHEIAEGLVYGSDAYKLTDGEIEKVIAIMETWEEDEPNINKELNEHFSNQIFIKLFERPHQPLKWILDEQIAIQLNEKLQYCAKKYKTSIDPILKWLFKNKQELLKPKLFNTDLGQIRINANDNCCWISCEKLFITLLSKQCLPSEFEEKIVAAIVDSHPAPHRLLLTKIRSSLEQHGLSAEVEILRDIHVQTAWLSDFLSPTTQDKTSAITGAITRHWEAMGDKLRDELIEFGGKLRDHFHDVDISKVMKYSGLHGPCVKSDETLSRYNSFISTKPFDRGHLTTGQIFSFPTPENINCKTIVTPNLPEYWICLSPACDMVPGQKNKGQESDKLLAFTAARLHEISQRNAIKKATENFCVFLKINDEIKPFSILKDANPSGSPEWEQMIAENLGVFDAKTKILTITRITTANGKVEACVAQATVTAQLRSEYALNLLQKFGAQLSRPGLGMNFKSYG